MFTLFNNPVFFDYENLKFLRREDLTPEMRLDIAYTAITGNWGTINALAEQYGISRFFIYQLKNKLSKITKKAFGTKEHLPPEPIVKDILTFILSLRLEGRSGIIPISEIMKRFKISKYYSVGSVSQILDFFGSHLQNTIEQVDDEVKLIIASDEIFSIGKPILITVDPISSIILKMELADSRDIKKWKEHWECIKNNGFYAIYLVNDEGLSMAAAQKKVFPDIIRQADTFHGIAHKLGLWDTRFERWAEVAIINEYERYDRLDSIKNDIIIEKNIDVCEKAEKKTNKAILKYDNFHFLYLELISNLRVFNKTGVLNDRITAEENVKIILELMHEVQNEKLLKAIKSINNLLPELFPFLDEAKKVIDQLKQLGISDDILKNFCLAWQYCRNKIKAKKSSRKNYYKNKEKQKLLFLENVIPNKFLKLKIKIYKKLDTITQSSAIVENINSIVRMYLNTTKNHITQNFLNLIMFYLNHRRFVAGKRKNKTPLEIFTNTEQKKDWIELLLEKVPWQQFDFLKIS